MVLGLSSVAPLVRLPLTLVQGIESVVEDLSAAVTRVSGLLDDIEKLPGRVNKVIAAVEKMPDRINALLVTIEQMPLHLDAVISRADKVSTKAEKAANRADALVTEAAATLASIQPLLGALAEVDPSVIVTLLGDTTLELLPALLRLQDLVPVVEHLGTHVDNLDTTVAEVGALLVGIPGAARLLKRAETRPART